MALFRKKAPKLPRIAPRLVKGRKRFQTGRKSWGKKVLGGAAIAATAGLIAYGSSVAVRMNAAELAAKKAFFERKTKNSNEWVQATKALGITSKELNAITSLRPETLKAVEGIAKNAGLQEEGILRVLRTAAGNPEVFLSSEEFEAKLQALRNKSNQLQKSLRPVNDREAPNSAFIKSEIARLERARKVMRGIRNLDPKARSELQDLAASAELH